MKSISITYHQTPRRLRSSDVYKIVQMICREEKLVSFRHIHYVFISDDYMRSLNRQYKNKNTTTDVLAFDLSDKPETNLEAEIYINLDQAAKQAKEYQVQFYEEALRLVVHGLLHFLGYNDRTVKERERMISRGEDYLKTFYHSKK